MKLASALLTLLLTASPAAAQVGPPATCTHVASTGGSGSTCTLGSPCSIATAIGGSSPVTAGETLCLRGGTYPGDLTSLLSGTSGSNITVRSYPDEWAKINDTSYFTEALIVLGQDTIYRDFEVYCSEVTRSSTSLGLDRGTGIRIFGPRTKLINMVVHDTGNGIFVNMDADNSVLYGLVLFNGGWIEPDRGHGHGIYAQSDTTLLIEEVISLNTYGVGMQCYTTSGLINGCTFKGVISFNNGSSGTFPGNPAGYSSNTRDVNIFVGANVNPIQNLLVDSVRLYHPPSALVGGKGNLQLGYAEDSVNLSTTVRDSDVIGGDIVTSMGTANPSNFNQLTFNDNFVAGPSTNIFRLWVSGGSPSIVGNNNTYYSAGSSSPFRYNNTSMSFATWKTNSGIDAASTFTQAAPTTNRVYIRANAYQTGRGNLSIYNPEGLTSVSVNLSTIGLTNGQGFEVRAAENYFGTPVLIGTYSSGSPSVSVPMNGTTVTAPIGNPSGFAPATTRPQYGAFVVLPTSAGGGNPTPTISSITPTSGTTAGGTALTDIAGTGFLAGATVTLGGSSATSVVVVSSIKITAVTPAHAAGAVNVVVTNTDAQSATLTNGYTYLSLAPTVTGISPTSGTTAGGTVITSITGTGFLSGATVTLGGASATSVNVVSGTSITAVTPAHAAGAVDVVVTNTDTQSGTLTNGYTYTAPTTPVACKWSTTIPCNP